MNLGKVFESDIKKSIPEYVLVYRLHDASQSFCKNENLRFSHKNPFDYIFFNTKKGLLYAIELKTVKGKSISFERNKQEKGDIHYHQIMGLLDWGKYDKVISGFIIEFREIGKTIFLSIFDFLKMQSLITKKSFTYNDLINYNVPYIVIPQKILKIHYRYDLETLFNETTFTEKSSMEVYQNEI